MNSSIFNEQLDTYFVECPALQALQIMPGLKLEVAALATSS